jgi:5-hydroxyisourate hydrolase
MTAISNHILDLARGVPAAGVRVDLLSSMGDSRWVELGSATTDQDGRAAGLAVPAGAPPGLCRLVFATGPYERAHGAEPFVEEASITFRVSGEARLHIPLLLSPFGLSIYRGS